MQREPRPELQHLLLKLAQFREGHLDIDELQKVLWSTAEALTSREDRKLREQLQDAEGSVERIRFTVNEDQVLDEVRKLAADVEALVANVVGGSSTSG